MKGCTLGDILLLVCEKYTDCVCIRSNIMTYLDYESFSLRLSLGWWAMDVRTIVWDKLAGVGMLWLRFAGLSEVFALFH